MPQIQKIYSTKKESQKKKIFNQKQEKFSKNCRQIVIKILNNIPFKVLKDTKNNTIGLKFLLQFIEGNNTQKLSAKVKNLISTYKLVDQLKLGNKSLNTENGYDFQLTEKDFVDLFTGKYARDILFENKSLEKKRHYIEEYTKVIISFFNFYFLIFLISLQLYEFIGGDKNGISRKALYELLKDSLNYGSDGYSNGISEKGIKDEVEEILKFVNSNSENDNKSDYISLNDFVNILTS